MNVQDALNILMNEEPIVVAGKTFTPESIDEVRLDTGDMVYLVRDGGDLWLSMDPESDEVILFSDVAEEVDASAEVASYAGEDYEFSYEANGKIEDGGEEIETVTWREFEKDDGTILRVTELEVGGESYTSIGNKIPEDELQEL